MGGSIGTACQGTNTGPQYSFHTVAWGTPAVGSVRRAKIAGSTSARIEASAAAMCVIPDYYADAGCRAVGDTSDVPPTPSRKFQRGHRRATSVTTVNT
jgi:hypothetical protein